MAMLTCECHVPESSVPESIVAGLADATGLEWTTEELRSREGHTIAGAYLLCASGLPGALELRVSHGVLRVSSGVPPHPYAWIHLKRTIDGIGERTQSWPRWEDRVAEALSRRWLDVSPTYRLVLGRALLWPLWPKMQ